VPVAVICAAFDAEPDEVIEGLRAEAEAAGLRVRRAHRPHFTLAAARVAQDEIEAVVESARAIAARHSPVALTMTHLGRFASGVLWLGPEPSDALRDLQRDASATLADHWPPAFGEQTNPANWIPHCTLATRVPRPALDRFARRPVTPFLATVDALAVLLVGGQGDVAHLPLFSAG
jgi:2'-5' RNA ligase